MMNINPFEGNYRQNNAIKKQEVENQTILNKYIGKNPTHLPNKNESNLEKSKEAWEYLVEEAQKFDERFDRLTIKQLKEKISSIEDQESFIVKDSQARLDELEIQDQAFKTKKEMIDQLEIISTQIENNRLIEKALIEQDPDLN